MALKFGNNREEWLKMGWAEEDRWVSGENAEGWEGRESVH